MRRKNFIFFVIIYSISLNLMSNITGIYNTKNIIFEIEYIKNNELKLCRYKIDNHYNLYFFDKTINKEEKIRISDEIFHLNSNLELDIREGLYNEWENKEINILNNNVIVDNNFYLKLNDLDEIFIIRYYIDDYNMSIPIIVKKNITDNNGMIVIQNGKKIEKIIKELNNYHALFNFWLFLNDNKKCI